MKQLYSYDSVRNLLSNHTILKSIVTSSFLMLITGIIIYIFPLGLVRPNVINGEFLFESMPRKYLLRQIDIEIEYNLVKLA